MGNDSPLKLHASGNWYKAIRGKFHYFGKDEAAALRKWAEQRDYLLAGVEPPAESLSVGVLITKFLDSKQRKVDCGELSQRSFNDYHQSAKRAGEYFGYFKQVQLLKPEDFGKYRAELAKTLGPTSLGNEVNRCRILFRYAYTADLIAAPIKYGDEFDQPSKKVSRAIKNESELRMFEAAQIRAMLGKANHLLKGAILLAINCGFGQTDIATLPIHELDLEAGFVTYPRPKTSVPRRCPLWPETVEALRVVHTRRKEPRLEADRHLAFVTRQGYQLVRLNPNGKKSWIDTIGLQFGKLLRSLKIKQVGLNFYSLRRTFRTIADEVKDDDAVDLIMGHTDSADMGALYTQRIGDERLLQVTNHVRKWLNL